MKRLEKAGHRIRRHTPPVVANPESALSPSFPIPSRLDANALLSMLHSIDHEVPPDHFNPRPHSLYVRPVLGLDHRRTFLHEPAFQSLASGQKRQFHVQSFTGGRSSRSPDK